MQKDFSRAVMQAAGREDVRAGVRQIYAELQARIDARQPVCAASGRCCRFEEYGHQLYVTTAELATFVHDLTKSGKNLEQAMSAWDGAGCPFQIGKLCGVHAIRPFGCRIFFCDPTAQSWQQKQYEEFHQRLKQLHATKDVPYFYLEWSLALRHAGGHRDAIPMRGIDSTRGG